MFVSIKLEDVSLTAEYRADTDQPKCDLTGLRPQMWHVLVTDEFTLTSRSAKWDNREMAAVLALMMSEDLPVDTSRALYRIAEPLFKDWPQNVRPIP